MALIDVFAYNGEEDILEIRLNILGNIVDQFVICECPLTFSGNPKPLYFNKEKFKRWMPKIKYYIIDPHFDINEIYRGCQSAATEYGQKRWMQEFLQKEAVKKALTHLKDNDIVFYGDCDEIWDPYMGYQTDTPFKCMQYMYVYYLNQRSNEQWWGTVITPYKFIKNNCLNDMRNFTVKDLSYYRGWHFSSPAKRMKQKMLDGYTKETYATDWVMDNLEKNVKENKDFLGRDFKYWTEEKDWPDYLQRNKGKYLNLCK